VPVLQLQGGRFIKVAADPCLADYVEAAARAQPRQVVAAVLALVAQAGSVQRAPLQLLAGHMASALRALAGGGAAVAVVAEGDGAGEGLAVLDWLLGLGLSGLACTWCCDRCWRCMRPHSAHGPWALHTALLMVPRRRATHFAQSRLSQCIHSR
jgi:hypothetical protein